MPRNDIARSYRWSPADRELIDRLKRHFASRATGEDCPEVDVLRAALAALAQREGLKKIQKKS